MELGVYGGLPSDDLIEAGLVDPKTGKLTATAKHIWRECCEAVDKKNGNHTLTTICNIMDRIEDNLDSYYEDVKEK